MSFTDVKIKIPDRNETRDVSDITHRKRGLRFEKSQKVEFHRLKKTFDFRSSPRPCGGCRAWWGADGKVVIERLCLSLPYVEKPFNSKVIKSFAPELRNRKCFFFFFCVSGFLCYLCVRYGHYERFAYRYEYVNFTYLAMWQMSHINFSGGGLDIWSWQKL